MAKKKSAEAAAPKSNKKAEKANAPKDNSLFWTMMSVAVAFVGAAIAKQLLNLLWRAATGKNPPTNPSSPDVQAGEAVTWAVASGAAIALARILATRRAAGYYARSTGHLPPGLEQSAKS